MVRSKCGTLGSGEVVGLNAKLARPSHPLLYQDPDVQIENSVSLAAGFCSIRGSMRLIRHQLKVRSHNTFLSVTYLL